MQPLNVGEFDAVFNVERLHQFDESLLVCWRNHDLDASVESARLSPEVVVGSLVVKLNQNVKGQLILGLNFVHLVPVYDNLNFFNNLIQLLNYNFTHRNAFVRPKPKWPERPKRVTASYCTVEELTAIQLWP